LPGYHTNTNNHILKQGYNQQVARVQRYMEDVRKMYGRCMEDVWKMYGRCMEEVYKKRIILMHFNIKIIANCPDIKLVTNKLWL